MNRTPSTGTIVAIQNETALEVCRGSRPIGVLLHAHGMLRLFEDPSSGQLYAEVNGMRSHDARHFLSLLEDMPDIAADVLVADAPELYPLEGPPVRDRHVRRHG